MANQNKTKNKKAHILSITNIKGLVKTANQVVDELMDKVACEFKKLVTAYQDETEAISASSTRPLRGIMVSLKHERDLDFFGGYAEIRLFNKDLKPHPDNLRLYVKIPNEPYKSSHFMEVPCTTSLDGSIKKFVENYSRKKQRKEVKVFTKYAIDKLREFKNKSFTPLCMKCLSAAPEDRYAAYKELEKAMINFQKAASTTLAKDLYDAYMSLEDPYNYSNSC